MPLAVDGPRTEPPVSVPSPAIANAAAIDAPVPPDDPDGVRVRSCGLRICPPSELCAAPDANSDRFAFAMMTAPAARSFFTTNASSGGIDPSSSTEPPVVGMIGGIDVVLDDDRNAVQRRARALGLALGIHRARGLERLRIDGDHRVQRRTLAIVGIDARQEHLHQPLRGQRALGKRGVDVGDRRRIQIDRLLRRQAGIVRTRPESAWRQLE